jgi:hypothetical protein
MEAGIRGGSTMAGTGSWGDIVGCFTSQKSDDPWVRIMNCAVWTTRVCDVFQSRTDHNGAFANFYCIFESFMAVD